MTQIIKEDFKAEMNLVAIELLESSVILPPDKIEEEIKFHFNISIENKAESDRKVVISTVFIEITNNESVKVGSIKVNCIYKIINFEDLIKPNEEGKVSLIQNLLMFYIHYRYQRQGELCLEYSKGPFYMEQFFQ